MAKNESINGEITSSVTLTDAQKRLVMACIETQMQSVKRSINTEKDAEVVVLRRAQYDRLADLQSFFR